MDDVRVAIVCSSGGHLAQMVRLDTWWKKNDRFWVTFDKADAHSVLGGERVYWGHYPTNRSLRNLVKNTIGAVRVLAKERPDVIVTNGAGIAVPYLWVGKLLFGCGTVYVEVYDRVDTATLTARLCSPVLDEMVIQWEDQRPFYPEATLLGPAL